MTSEEDQALMARISQLAGKINRVKNQQAGFVPSQPPSYRHSPYNRMSYRSQIAHGVGVDGFGNTGPSRGYSRGYHNNTTRAPHRNRTLVLNGASQQGAFSEGDSGATSDASGASFVSRNYPNRQLINSSIYGKNGHHALDLSERQKQTARNLRERSKLLNHLANGGGHGTANSRGPANNYEVVIDGIRFLVTKNGSKLIKAPGGTQHIFPGGSADASGGAYPCSDGNNSSKATPKVAFVGGVKFYRSKHGNLYRHGIVKAQRRSGTVSKINVPCRTFSTTGNILTQWRTPFRTPKTTSTGSVSSPRSFANCRIGSCPTGPKCRYMHDPAKVAVCKDMLKGTCLSGDACDLSHEFTPERTPHCLHFAKDSCNKQDCKYAHVKVSPGAPVCHAFGLYGYCEKGAECADRHVFECPYFSNTGVCRIRGCKLPHRERASILRRATNAANGDGDSDSVMIDVSSDEDGESVDSHDVDSDEVDEFIGQDEDSDFDIAQQPDFIAI